MLWLFLRYFCIFNKLRLDLNLPDALGVWPIEDAYHVALLWTVWPELELLFLAINVEADFSGPNRESRRGS